MKKCDNCNNACIDHSMCMGCLFEIMDKIKEIIKKNDKYNSIDLMEKSEMRLALKEIKGLVK